MIRRWLMYVSSWFAWSDRRGARTSCRTLVLLGRSRLEIDRVLALMFGAWGGPSELLRDPATGGSQNESGAVGPANYVAAWRRNGRGRLRLRSILLVPEPDLRGAAVDPARLANADAILLCPGTSDPDGSFGAFNDADSRLAGAVAAARAQGRVRKAAVVPLLADSAAAGLFDPSQVPLSLDRAGAIPPSLEKAASAPPPGDPLADPRWRNYLSRTLAPGTRLHALSASLAAAMGSGGALFFLPDTPGDTYLEPVLEWLDTRPGRLPRWFLRGLVLILALGVLFFGAAAALALVSTSPPLVPSSQRLLEDSNAFDPFQLLVHAYEPRSSTIGEIAATRAEILKAREDLTKRLDTSSTEARASARLLRDTLPEKVASLEAIADPGARRASILRALRELSSELDRCRTVRVSLLRIAKALDRKADLRAVDAWEKEIAACCFGIVVMATEPPLRFQEAPKVPSDVTQRAQKLLSRIDGGLADSLARLVGSRSQSQFCETLEGTLHGLVEESVIPSIAAAVPQPDVDAELGEIENMSRIDRYRNRREINALTEALRARTTSLCAPSPSQRAHADDIRRGLKDLTRVQAISIEVRRVGLEGICWRPVESSRTRVYRLSHGQVSGSARFTYHGKLGDSIEIILSNSMSPVVDMNGSRCPSSEKSIILSLQGFPYSKDGVAVTFIDDAAAEATKPRAFGKSAHATKKTGSLEQSR